MVESKKVVLLGAGVVGLQTAITLQESDLNVQVTIIAEHLPGDRTINYCSPWAGGHHVIFWTGSTSAEDLRQLRFDKETFAYMVELLRNDPAVPLEWIRHESLYEENKPAGQGIDVYRDVYPNYHVTPADQLPDGIAQGCSYDSLCIDAPSYLEYLGRKFEGNGGKLVRRKLSRMSSAIDESEPPQLVINCTGLGAGALVKDENVYPTRGQTVIVNAPWIKISRSRAKPKGQQGSYIIPRRSGAVILGGTREDNDWHGEPRVETKEDICKKCVELMPELIPEAKRANRNWKDLDIIDEGCGLRPSRKGGIRIEHDLIRTSHGSRVPLIHNYGHSGAGYQSSYGSAMEVLQLAKAVLS